MTFFFTNKIISFSVHCIGRKMEKLGEDWYCPSCREDLNNKGIPKEELKVHKIAEKKALERVEKEKRLEKKRKNLSKKPRVRKDSSSKHSSAHDEDDDDHISSSLIIVAIFTNNNNNKRQQQLLMKLVIVLCFVLFHFWPTISSCM